MVRSQLQTQPQEHQKRIRSQYNMRLAELEREREGIEEEKVRYSTPRVL